MNQRTLLRHWIQRAAFTVVSLVSLCASATGAHGTPTSLSALSSYGVLGSQSLQVARRLMPNAQLASADFPYAATMVGMNIDRPADWDTRDTRRLQCTLHWSPQKSDLWDQQWVEHFKGTLSVPEALLTKVYHEWGHCQSYYGLSLLGEQAPIYAQRLQDPALSEALADAFVLLWLKSHHSNWKKANEKLLQFRTLEPLAPWHTESYLATPSSLAVVNTFTQWNNPLLRTCALWKMVGHNPAVCPKNPQS